MRPNSSTTIVKITLRRSAYEISQLSSRSSAFHSTAASVPRATSSSTPTKLPSLDGSIGSTRRAHEPGDRRRPDAPAEDHVADVRGVPAIVEQQHGLQIDDAARELVAIVLLDLRGERLEQEISEHEPVDRGRHREAHRSAHARDVAGADAEQHLRQPEQGTE